MNQDTTPKLIEIPFDCDSYNVSGINLSFLDSGGDKPPLHFYHANGFPVSVYLPMMIRLTEHYRVIGLGLRGQDAQTAGNTSWHQVAEDLISFLDDQQLGPVLGVGHSVGGVATMFAAARRPDLFSRIILIDPVILPYTSVAALAVMRLFGKKKNFFPAKRARARRNGWTDRFELYEYLKTKSLFKRFDDTYLKSYVTYGFKPADGGGVELLCPPEAEARIFENYPLDVWFWVQRLKIPVLIVRGEYSDVLFERTVIRICRKAENASSYLMEGAGHLIPMEKPDELIHLIEDFFGKQ
ncbi:alpha/beta fold hydrolase [Desulfopila aestuarii]|uniref:Pimeloyl-ACP methyl ester carboxylesterase n=1 Tax=Desulfopila aestuarii DSM 18488 TaxID=1121416 RepID=A0A1M7XYG4_9BACT|nr:alpha/beta hydrolase [Desulfopila aestuarii]SHO44092.1 Pimeloyl-ACP methyl ester carboxylesterase [Desulfopila aestuarii DSM 18488]